MSAPIFTQYLTLINKTEGSGTKSPGHTNHVFKTIPHALNTDIELNINIYIYREAESSMSSIPC